MHHAILNLDTGEIKFTESVEQACKWWVARAVLGAGPSDAAALAKAREKAAVVQERQRQKKLKGTGR